MFKALEAWIDSHKAELADRHITAILMSKVPDSIYEQMAMDLRAGDREATVQVWGTGAVDIHRGDYSTGEVVTTHFDFTQPSELGGELNRLVSEFFSAER
jgi:hypothetical protein